MTRESLGVLQGRYRLEAVIGIGGMATVYRARDQLLGRQVAVKVFNAQAADDLEVRQQEAEARVLASLNMHGLVTLLDAGVEFGTGGRPRVFLVMELVEGADLKTLIARGPFTLRQVAHFGFDLAEALEYVHEHGVIHRDVKPANVLLLDYGSERRPRVKLADFGIATIVGRGSLLEEEYTTGTAAYLSPEQAAGEPIGPATDVYSLGLVLLECITGRVAYPGSVVDSALARLKREPEIPADLPDEWRGVLRAMLQRNPADRPSLGDLVLAFRQLIVEDDRTLTGALPTAPSPEAARVAATRSYGVLDTPPDATFDRITALAARVFDVPIALVALTDEKRVFFKSHHGLDLEGVLRTPDGPSELLTDGPVVIPDTLADPRTAGTTLVTGPPYARFVATMPLVEPGGYSIGSLALLGVEPRDFTRTERQTLEDLAAMVMHELELRAAARRALLARN